MARKVLLYLTFALGMAVPAMAQVDVGTKGTLKGTVFGDYYWMALSHDSEIEGSNGFWFRRIYLTYDHEISESFSGRLRLSMDSAGDFISDSKLEPTIKDAWLKWSSDDHEITAGIAPTPTWRVIEDVWGYRSVEKTPLDLHNFGNSRDFGVAVRGNLDAADNLTYHFMFANGNGRSAELNKGKKMMLALGYNFTKNIVFQVYGDWNDIPGTGDSYTGQAFLGYKSEGFSLGALYAHQLREYTDSTDLGLDLMSFFTNVKLNDRFRTFARVDYLSDKNPAGPDNDFLPMSNEAESTFLTAGLDIKLHDKISLIPNAEVIIYGENAAGERPGTVLMPRVTLAYSF